MNAKSFFNNNRFVLVLLALFLLTDLGISYWNPMVTSRRFYKNDFTKTLMFHQQVDSGRIFFGNSSVTGAYLEDKSRYPLVEMGLSYGKITDLQQILKHPWYHVQDQLVLAIDVHTMIDSLETDPTYAWLKPWYQPYVYTYRDYFRDSGGEAVRNLYSGLVELKPAALFSFVPRWADKELYFGRMSNEELQKKWDDYNKRFGAMTLPDFKKNIDALKWVVAYTRAHQINLKVVWMPWDKAFPQPPYVKSLKPEVNRILQEGQIPILDLMDRYEPLYFHDLVHLNREDGAPIFTKDVDEWLLSFAKPSKS
jgi:hypothetical protein